MARTPGGPSHNRYSFFRLEEAVITDVNRKTWTVTVETRHSAKTVTDIQCMAQYHHYANGEGIHHLPEVGAICLLGWPSDNTPPFVMGYLGLPSVEITPDDQAARSQTTDNPQGSPTDVGFRSRRPELNPGDVGLTTRDENFVILRRGGIVQIGSTALSQRLYIPVLNYIKDFCENYEMQSFGGDLSWTVARSESDPSGKAPATWTLDLLEYAQDTKATVQVRYLPVAEPGSDKSAWEVTVAPQGIDRDTGSVSGAVYTLKVGLNGDRIETITGSRSTEVQGSDTLEVGGDHSTTVGGSTSLTAGGSLEHIASGTATLGGAAVRLGSRAAAQSAVLGPALVSLLSQPMIVLPPGGVGPPIGTAVLSPSQIALLTQMLSTKVFLE